MRKKLKDFIIGPALENSQLEGEKLRILWGLPIYSSDTISSVAYAGEEVLMVLFPVMALLATRSLIYVMCAIIGLLAILVFCYCQTIDAYPQGGAYIVGADNLGEVPGLVAASALLVLLMKRIKSHYDKVAASLHVTEDPETLLRREAVPPRVLMPVQSVNRSFLKSLNYVLSLGVKDIEFYYVSSGDGREEQLPKGGTLTVVLSQFTCEESWANTLHNQTSIQLKLQLNQRRNVTCISIPYIS